MQGVFLREFRKVAQKKTEFKEIFLSDGFPCFISYDKIASRTESVKKHHNLVCSDFCQVLVGDVTLTIEPIKP